MTGPRAAPERVTAVGSPLRLGGDMMGTSEIRLRRLAVWLTLGFVLANPFAVALARQDKQPQVVKTPEQVFRKLISKLVMPVYPDAARRRGERGVAVAEVLVDEQGRLADVQILEAPSAEIGEAVIAAVRQCRFSAAESDGGPIRVSGKLTFYFVIDRDGLARVENPRKFK